MLRHIVDAGLSQDVRDDSSRVFIDMIGCFVIHDVRDIHAKCPLQEDVVLRTDIITDTGTIDLHKLLNVIAGSDQHRLTLTVVQMNAFGDFKNG